MVMTIDDELRFKQTLLTRIDITTPSGSGWAGTNLSRTGDDYE